MAACLPLEYRSPLRSSIHVSILRLGICLMPPHQLGTWFQVSCGCVCDAAESPSPVVYWRQTFVSSLQRMYLVVDSSPRSTSGEEVRIEHDWGMFQMTHTKAGVHPNFSEDSSLEEPYIPPKNGLWL